MRLKLMNIKKLKDKKTVFFVLWLMMLAMVPELISANKKKILIAKPEISTLAGMRAISKFDDGSYEDMSTNLMRVGTGPAEIRVAVCKPSFTESTTLYSDWTVTNVDYSVAGTAAIMSQPLMYWSDTTPLEAVYEMNRTTMSDTYLVNMFQTQIESGGNYARTTGVFLWGTDSLQAAGPVNLTFNVTIEKESSLQVEALDVLQTMSGTRILRWKSSFRGKSDIYVNNVRKVMDQFTVADRINRNTIWTDWMQSGTNEVYVKVTDPYGYTSIGTSNILTFTK